MDNGKSAYSEGYDAASAAYSGNGLLKENPYPDGSPEAEQWMEGYLDAGDDWDNLQSID
jgi:hypothetical protein